MLVLLLLLLLVMQLCQLPNGHMARRACIQALNEQPQNASRQVKSEEEEEEEEEEGKTGRHCADAMNSWRRGEFFKIATSHRTRARHEQPTLLLLHSSCCLPHAACLVPAWQSTHLFLCLCCCCCGWGLPLVIVVNYLCISKFIWNTKANALLALLCSLDAAQLCPGQEFHSMAFQMLFYRASRIFSWLFVDFMYCFSCFTCPKMGAQSGARTPRALRPHMVTLICPPPNLSLSLSPIHPHSLSLSRSCCK